MYACVFAPQLEPGGRAVMLERLSDFSPLLASGGTGSAGERHATIDIRGLSALFGPPRELAAKITSALEAAGIRVNVAVAANPHAAAMAARGCPGITIIPEGSEGRMLAHLPLSQLDPDDEISDTLFSWGIRTFGELAKLPATGVAERLGPAGVRLHHLARGRDARTIVLDKPEKRYEAALAFEHGVDSLEPLSFILSRLLHDICGQLTADSLATSELHLELTLENGGRFENVLRLPFAGRDPATFLRLWQYNLQSNAPEQEIFGVRIRAIPVPQRLLQGGLFVPLAPQPEKLELTLTRVAAIVGKQNIGSPELLNTHEPGAFRMTPFDAQYQPPCREKQMETTPLVAVRLFRPPVPAEVVFTGGRPARIRSKGVSGAITVYAGPWRISGGWWSEQPWARDEWDIQIGDGPVYRIYCDARKGWFVEGNYD